MDKLSYKEYLKSDHWQSLKWRLKEKTYYQICFICDYYQFEAEETKRRYERRASECEENGEYCKAEYYLDLAREYNDEAKDPQKVVLHHCNYENLGHENEKDIVPLCEDCHRLLHFIGQIHPTLVNKKLKKTIIKFDTPPFGFRSYPQGIAFNELHIMLRDDLHLRRIFC